MSNSDEYIRFQCIEICQPIGKFYIGKINHKDLLEISYADRRRLFEGEDERFFGIQRPLSPVRVQELEKYVNNIDATFTTGIILAIPSSDFKEKSENVEGPLVEFDENKKEMRVLKRRNIAKIIDGQHRIAGLEKFDGAVFELNVTIFVDMEEEDQAMVFSTINLKHTKVSKSLAYDLLAYAKSRSPQKTCHDIVRILNKKSNSPFFRKIKILGQATDDRQETLTQAAFVDRLLPFITSDPMGDRDLIKRGKKPAKIDEKKSEELIFRNLFIDEKDIEILQNIWNFFVAVSNRWPEAWQEVKPRMILNRTTGFSALMRFLHDCYLLLDKKRWGVVTDKDYRSIFEKIDIKDSDFNRQTYLPGSTGASDLYRKLREISKIG